MQQQHVVAFFFSDLSSILISSLITRRSQTANMEQYTTTTTTSGEQIVVQTNSGQIQQQVMCETYRQYLKMMYSMEVCPSKSIKKTSICSNKASQCGIKP